MPEILSKIKLKRISRFLKRAPLLLARHAFLTFLGLFFFFLLLGGAIFYQYSILVQGAEVEGAGTIIKFDQKRYDSIHQILQEREDNFSQASGKLYSNPFQFKVEEEVIEEELPPAEEEPSILEEELPEPEESASLLEAKTLSEFYALQGKKLPSAETRSLLWEALGLGVADSYKGFDYQNELLLEALKLELTN